jgi:nucleoside-diphosphate-sugar epimerase
MRVAVTGGRGFVGRHVVDELARRGVEVIATMRPGSAPDAKAAANVRWVPLDIANAGDNAFTALGEPDVLLHLAWGGLPNYKALSHIETELPLQYRFLSSLVRGKLPALVSVGTCLEYGQQSGALAADLETRPETPYGFAKDSLRKQLEFLKAVRPFKLTWARLFYIYGEGQAKNSLYPLLKAAAATGQRRFPMSGGEQLRDYLSVAEVARKLADLALGDADSGPCNVCSGTPVSVRRMVETWIRENGWDMEPVYGELPYPNYEPMAFWGGD